ncbi:MAG: hypothetical protein HGA73_00630 [Syntrophaceae bacterium]|nr:hypothetical protein [Syntrophaceae bacterium]
MIGTKLYQKKERLYLFLALYGILAMLGTAYSIVMVTRGQDPSGAAGFMIVFGAGMCIRTYVRGRKPVVEVLEERLELNKTNRTEYIRYMDITSVERRDAGQIVLKVRDGHTPRKVIIYGKYLEKKDAEQLAAFLGKKGWKR